MNIIDLHVHSLVSDGSYSPHDRPSTPEKWVSQPSR